MPPPRSPAISVFTGRGSRTITTPIITTGDPFLAVTPHRAAGAYRFTTASRRTWAHSPTPPFHFRGTRPAVPPTSYTTRGTSIPSSTTIRVTRKRLPSIPFRRRPPPLHRPSTPPIPTLGRAARPCPGSPSPEPRFRSISTPSPSRIPGFILRSPIPSAACGWTPSFLITWLLTSPPSPYPPCSAMTARPGCWRPIYPVAYGPVPASPTRPRACLIP